MSNTMRKYIHIFLYKQRPGLKYGKNLSNFSLKKIFWGESNENDSTLPEMQKVK